MTKEDIILRVNAMIKKAGTDSMHYDAEGRYDKCDECEAVIGAYNKILEMLHTLS